MQIIVDGKEIEHNPGNPIYYIWFGSETGEVSIRDSLCVGKVEIDEDCVRYFDNDDTEWTEDNMKNSGVFWDREEAEKWLSENFSGTLKYKPNEEVFIIMDGFVVSLRLRRTDFIYVEKGRVVYEFCLSGCPDSSTRILVDDLTEKVVIDTENRENICPVVFKSYQMAKDFFLTTNASNL